MNCMPRQIPLPGHAPVYWSDAPQAEPQDADAGLSDAPQAEPQDAEVPVCVLLFHAYRFESAILHSSAAGVEPGFPVRIFTVARPEPFEKYAQNCYLGIKE